MNRTLDRRALLTMTARGLLGAGALGVLLAACGSDGDPGATPTSRATTPTTAPFDPDVAWWLQGNFRPVAEEVDAFDLEVRGTLPAALSGLYVRNGSNAARADSGHWFLGDGMVHGVRLDAGRASWYRNRWVRTTPFVSGRPLAESPPGGDVSQSNVSAIHHAGRRVRSAGPR